MKFVLRRGFTRRYNAGVADTWEAAQKLLDTSAWPRQTAGLAAAAGVAVSERVVTDGSRKRSAARIQEVRASGLLSF